MSCCCLNYVMSGVCRGVGCIFCEMASGRPLFPGSTVDDQLRLIFRTLGIPTDETWPNISSNEGFLTYKFDQIDPEPLVTRAPRLDSEGIDLLAKFLKVAKLFHMLHMYFNFYSRLSITRVIWCCLKIIYSMTRGIDSPLKRQCNTLT